jgi:superfamily II DNA or RNA helicase
VKLRDYQKRAVREIDKRIKSGCLRVLAVGPVACGKGTIAAWRLARLARQGKRGILIVHRREIVLDIADRVRKATGQEVDVILPGHKRNGARIKVASVQSLIKAKHVPVDEVIIDECHHYPGPSKSEAEERRAWRSVLRRYRRTPIVGFTATPERSDHKPLGEVFQQIVEIATYSEMLRKRKLVRCRVFRPERPLKTDLAQDAVEAYKRYTPGRSAFVFVKSVHEAHRAAAAFKKAKIPAAFVTERTPKRIRDAALADLAAGKISVVVNVYTMTEGVDVPAVDTIILGRWVDHASTYVQITGRAMRMFARKKHAILLDLAGSSWVHGLPHDDRTYSLTGRQAIGQHRKGDPPPQRERGSGSVLGLDLVEVDPNGEVLWRTSFPNKKKGIDWDKQPLGKMYDRALADKLSVSRSSVCQAREKLGIPPYGECYDLDDQPFGKVPDSVIAEKLGMCNSTVSKARRMRGIPSWSASAAIDWDSELRLGKMSDGALASLIGTSPTAVRYARDRRGIPAYPRKKVDWDQETRLGKILDCELAKQLGVSPTIVGRARARRDIPPFKSQSTTSQPT